VLEATDNARNCNNSLPQIYDYYVVAAPGGSNDSAEEDPKQSNESE